MNNTDKIMTPLYEIAGYIVGTAVSKQNEQEALNRIVNNSGQAILYVSLIENEFEIEIDDEDINLDFFTSFDYVEGIIKKRLANAS